MSSRMNVFSCMLFLICFVSDSFAQPVTLQEKWEQKKSNLLKRVSEFKEEVAPSMDEDVLSSFRGRHFFLVPGVLNEWANIGTERYYRTFRRVLDRYSVSHSMYHSRSRNTISTNADLIYEAILQTFARVGKPLVIVGHSKGGGELLTVLLRHQELLLNRIVDRYVSIQGAIGGSPLANANSWRVSMLKPIYANGLNSLKPEAALENITQAFLNLPHTLNLSPESEEYSQVLQIMREKIFYVRSRVDRQNLSWSISGVRWAVRGYMWTSGKDVYDSQSGQCDGLMAVEDQMFSVNGVPFGVDLGIVDADHTGLTVSTFGNTTSQDRAAFTAALLETLFEKSLELEMRRGEPKQLDCVPRTRLAK